MNENNNNSFLGRFAVNLNEQASSGRLDPGVQAGPAGVRGDYLPFLDEGA